LDERPEYIKVGHEVFNTHILLCGI